VILQKTQFRQAIDVTILCKAVCLSGSFEGYNILLGAASFWCPSLGSATILLKSLLRMKLDNSDVSASAASLDSFRLWVGRYRPIYTDSNALFAARRGIGIRGRQRFARTSVGECG
jgi:hypothetical protein